MCTASFPSQNGICLGHAVGNYSWSHTYTTQVFFQSCFLPEIAKGLYNGKCFDDVIMCAWSIFLNIFYFCSCENENIERHTAHIIVSLPNPKQWVIVHSSDLMMIIRQSMYIISIITQEMGKLKTHSPTYCIIDNWENMLNLTHTLDKLYKDMVICSNKIIGACQRTCWSLKPLFSW